MTPEDEEFNRIERESGMRMESVVSICRVTTPEDVRRIIKPWVGLTDAEIREFDVDPVEAKAMIQKLKEKNK
jgi:hypothetical protein